MDDEMQMGEREVRNETEGRMRRIEEEREVGRQEKEKEKDEIRDGRHEK